MPFLKEQISLINQSLLKVAFADQRFQGGRFETIAYDVARSTAEGGKEIFPAVMNRDYMPEEITVDDTYPVIIYHKILSSKYDPFGKNDYGQGLANQRQLSTVKMVVYGKFSAVKMTREALEALIITNFPDNFPAADIAPLKLTSVKVQPLNTNFNTRQVWQEEYQGFDLRLSAEDIFFSITYSLETIFTKGCFQICNCE